MLIYLAPNFASRRSVPMDNIRIRQGFRGHARLHESVKELHLPKLTVKQGIRSKVDRHFMEFGNDVEIPEHSYDSQWGVVLAGEIELFIEDKKFIFRKGDTYFIPAGDRHSAKIKA